MADIYAPASDSASPLPLVLAPHPITWTAREDYHGGVAGLRRGYHPGWYGLADKYSVVIAMPHGHQRRVEFCSLASAEQIADMAHLIDELPAQGYAIDRQRVYACGLSMGGQEALVLAGRYPERVAAIVAFNPIVDLAAWQEDLAISEVSGVRENRTDLLVAQEVGGLPRDIPAAYAERSATGLVAGLAQVPALLCWSDRDAIVPRQTTHHAYRLYQRVKAQSPLSPIAEYNHTRIHGLTDFDADTCWQLHEWCDYELALRWLLVHQRTPA